MTSSIPPSPERPFQDQPFHDEASPGARSLTPAPQVRPPQRILEETFGYKTFRGSQKEIIDEVMAGRDALVLMPTGGGKSLCYQVPAMARPGVGIIVSPLIALMQDQVDALCQLGVRAALLNSTLEAPEAWSTEQALLSGELDLLYVAPERLIQPRMLDLLARAPLALFAIDEAHCVSQWGHDFRSDYLQLNLLHERFPHVPRIALTATADERTRREIAVRLELEQARHFVAGFDRPNIQYRITPKTQVRQQLLSFLRAEHMGDAGIVYCLSRKKVEQTADWLTTQGLTALPYHAGLSAEMRALHQRRFLREEGIIIVATIAFGMGIDKPDVRFVAHLDLPKSVEAYYQETGRAGRDGLPATAWMAYGLQDVITLRQMLEGSPGHEDFKRVERARLEAMLGLCEMVSCRRQALLRYFGETGTPPCGNCDTCLTPVKTRDATTEVQKALSCVYRTGQRFGVNHLIDVLRGSQGEKIKQFGHDQVSTFGIGAETSAQQWRAIFRQLVAKGLLEVDLEGFGGLRLTEACRPILKGEQHIELAEDAPAKASRSSRGSSSKKEILDLSPAEMMQWEALRACRKRLADEQGVPPYVIFHDATLLEILRGAPQTLDDLQTINGVGERKLEKYGADFLEVTRGG
ncbi:MAG: DNA helicase RecQ [Alteromonadaceae bacterium]|nr:DNA helicase RecQ [Alteromonadaceae bacterium]